SPTGAGLSPRGSGDCRRCHRHAPGGCRMSADFLAEIGTEELPPKALLNLSEVFREEILTGLRSAGLGHGDTTLYAAPRRLALLVTNLDEQTPSKEIINWGPPA